MANPKSLAAQVLDFARAKIGARRAELTSEQAAVANWLRGNVTAINSIRELLNARVEARGSSPIPSDPNAALTDKARDYECRAIMGELVALFNSPMPSLNTGDEE